MCRVFQVPKAFQEKRVLWVPVDLLVLPNLVLQDPGVPQGPKVPKVVVDILVNLDQIVKVQSQVLEGIPVYLDEMEIQDVLARLG